MTIKKYHGSLAISQEELALMVETIMKRKPKKKSKYFYFCNIRDSMILLLGWFLGMRSKNYLELEMHEIDVKKRTIYISPIKSKTGEEDFLIIPRCLIPRLKIYLAIRKKLFQKSKWVFPARRRGEKENHLNYNTFSRMFREILKSSGLYHVRYIDKQGHKRSLRSSHGLRKGSGTKVQEILGDVEKTAIFLTHIDPRRRATFGYIHLLKEKIRHQICDEVFDEIWKDERKIQSQVKRLIKLLELSQNKHIPIVKI